jgi:hypothetical protein
MYPLQNHAEETAPSPVVQECFDEVVASKKHSAFTSSVKWDVYGRGLNLRSEFSNKVCAIMPDGER